MNSHDTPPPRPTSDSPWYVSAFDAGYLDRYSHRDSAEAERQVAFLCGAGVLHLDELVLDLCCGAGRHLAALAERGTIAVGVDLSPDLLRVARNELSRRRAHAELMRADMRALPFADGAFDAVLQMFTAFGYFEADDDNRRVLTEVARVTRGGGCYVLDLMNKARVLELLVAASKKDVRAMQIAEERRYDAERKRVEKTITTRTPRGATSHRESVRVFDADEIRAWLDAAGFGIDRMLGDFDGSPFDAATSARMITVARRR